MKSPASAAKPRSNLRLRRLHRGDIMSPEKRSALMARIRGKGTKPELAVAELLRQKELFPELHASDLPGCPDFVFRNCRVAVFVDGDFWHGWHFSQWRLKLSERWERKIANNMRRDERNFRALRRAGWKVVRLWEHRVEKDPEQCLKRILDAIPSGGVLAKGREGRDSRRTKAGRRQIWLAGFMPAQRDRRGNGNLSQKRNESFRRREASGPFLGGYPL